MGFSENLQNYIVDIKLYAIQEDWKYPNYIPDNLSTKKVNFNHYVNVQFVKIDERYLSDGTINTDITENFSMDWLYPLFLRQLSGALYL